VRFGDYALDLLPRVAHSIFTHFQVPQNKRVDAMVMARVPVDVMTRVNNCLPITLISEPPKVSLPITLKSEPPKIRPRAKPGSSSRRGSTARRPRQRPGTRVTCPADVSWT